MENSILTSESKEVIQARKLFEEGKFEKAFSLIKKFEGKKTLIPMDQLSCNLLKSSILNRFGNYEKSLKFAEKAYQESQELKNNLSMIDALLNMAWALSFLGDLEKVLDLTTQSEDILRTLNEISIKEHEKIEADIAFIKAQVYWFKGNVDRGLEYANRSLKLREKTGYKYEIVESLYRVSSFYILSKSDLEQALDILKRCLTLAEEIKHPYSKSYILMNLGLISRIKGELKKVLMYYEQCLPVFEKNNSTIMSTITLNNIGNTYRELGDLDQALLYLERGLSVAKKTRNNWLISLNIASIIESLVPKGEIEQAQEYLKQLEEINDKEDNKIIKLEYLYCKALVLKTSSRIHNRAKAEKIFRQIIQGEMILYEGTILALLNLCDLLLDELRTTNSVEILEELQPLITQLLEIAEESNSFWILGETHLLQAKLALIKLDLTEARRLLTQGQQITENFGLKLLAMKISNEHDELLKQLSIWENLKESKVSLTERMKLARIGEQIDKMLLKQVMETPKPEVELPVMLIIMTKEGNVLLSNPFTADMTIDDTLIGAFLSSCNTFCDQILSEVFDRVKFGKYTVLIKAINSYSICYLFQGQTYNAQQKLKHFSNTAKNESRIMEILDNAVTKGRVIKVNENPPIEELIIESFMSDPQMFQMPFKAYMGDEPFVFVSYTHADKLEVYPIIDYLNKMGINIWYDEGIPISENWKKSIAVNLERCKIFLVFISHHIIDSEYVRKEISFAIKRHKPFFAVYLKETKLPTELEFEIADIQAMMKYLMPEAEFLNKLKELLSRSLYG
ncbi:MAG: tetratricopeptide repeat protein [Candidatus Hermodarchaeota archaeon]